MITIALNAEDYERLLEILRKCGEPIERADTVHVYSENPRPHTTIGSAVLGYDLRIKVGK